MSTHRRVCLLLALLLSLNAFIHVDGSDSGARFRHRRHASRARRSLLRTINSSLRNIALLQSMDTENESTTTDSSDDGDDEDVTADAEDVTADAEDVTGQPETTTSGGEEDEDVTTEAPTAADELMESVAAMCEQLIDDERLAEKAEQAQVTCEELMMKLAEKQDERDWYSVSLMIRCKVLHQASACFKLAMYQRKKRLSNDVGNK